MTTTQEKNAANNAWAEQRFGLDVGDVLAYNAGCAYDKVWVRSMRAARKVQKCMKGETCNGGCFSGMEKGGIVLMSDGTFEVIC